MRAQKNNILAFLSALVLGQLCVCLVLFCRKHRKRFWANLSYCLETISGGSPTCHLPLIAASDLTSSSCSGQQLMPRHGTPCLGEILLLKLHTTAAMDAGGMLCLQHCICTSGHGNSCLRKNAQCVCTCLQGPAKTWSALFSIICILAFPYLVSGAFVFGQLSVCLLLVSVATLPFLSLHVQDARVAAAAPVVHGSHLFPYFVILPC